MTRIDFKRFFLRAMGQSWAAGAEYTPVPGMPGYQRWRFQEEKLVLIDQYFTTPLSPYSEGSTIIWLDNTLVWLMNYYGQYKKAAIPLLKQALLYQYNNVGLFHGGRGPNRFESGELAYVCWVEGNFIRFSGGEQIDGPTGRLGYHRIRGRLLADLKP